MIDVARRENLEGNLQIMIDLAGCMCSMRIAEWELFHTEFREIKQHAELNGARKDYMLCPFNSYVAQRV